MAPPTVTLASANGLNHINDASFPEIFISNIDNIYAHEDSDISKILESKKKPMLKILWSKAISLLQDKHEPCKNRSPLDCRKKEKPNLISEISQICRFLSSPDESKKINLDSLFVMVSSPEEQPKDLTNPAELIEFVKQISSELVSLKCEVQETKDQNKILKIEIVELRAKLGSRVPATTKDEPVNAPTSSDGSDGDNESEDSESHTSSVSDQSDSFIFQKKRRSKKQNLVRAAPAYSSAFIGNVHPDVTVQALRNRICTEHKVQINLSDIEKLPTVGKSNAFKISVPKNKLNQLITGWPELIKAEPYSLRRPTVYAANNTRKSQSFTNNNRNRRFRNPQQNAFRQNHWFSPKNPHWNAPNRSNWTDQYSFRPNGVC